MKNKENYETYMQEEAPEPTHLKDKNHNFLTNSVILEQPHEENRAPSYVKLS